MLLNEGFFREVVDFGSALIDQNDPHQLKINPLFRAIGFTETLRYLQAFHRLTDPYLYFDFAKRKGVRSQYKFLAKLFLDDFKAKNRQFAKRQNIWFRKESEYLWLDVMSEGKIHNVVNRLIDHLRKPSLAQDLASAEQEKLKVVNSDEETRRDLKEYVSESRILANLHTLNQFLYGSLQAAKTHKDVVMHPLLIPESQLNCYHMQVNNRYANFYEQKEFLRQKRQTGFMGKQRSEM